MGMKERNYWIEAAKQKVLSDTKKADSYVSELMFLYDEAAYSIENEINALNGKYAKDNGLSDVEASKLLSGEEYSKWRKSIDHYVSDSSRNAKDSRIQIELNTLAMKSRISRKEQLLTNVYKNMMDLADKTETKMSELLGDVVKTNYYKGCFTMQKGTGIGFNVAKINDKKLQSVLEYPWSGKNFSKALWEDTDKLAALARKEITYGFITGSGIPKMAKAINDVMGKGKYAAERMVRTETSYFSNYAEKMAYEEHGVKKYEFIGGGCEDCQLLNRKVFLVSEAEVGLNYPPIHPNCKCTTKASFEIDLFKKRDGTNPLDDNMKFQEWKKKYTSSNQDTKVILTDGEQHALNQYISSEAYPLNEKLRNGTKLSKNEQNMIHNLDAALDKMPCYKGTLYRSISDFGISNTQKFINSYEVGKIPSFPSYISSSILVYDESFPIQYVIKSKNGKDIRAYNAGEQEVLFKRNTRFLVTKVEKNTIYMEEL